jgi:hypothetical protein
MWTDACGTLIRLGVRDVLCRSAFPLAPALRSTNSATDCSALFTGFIATMTGPDVPRSCIIGFGSSPSRCGPWGQCAQRSNAGPPRFRRDPFERDWVFDHGRASAPRKTVPHMLPSTLLTGSASASFCLSRLNSQPHSIVVYASLPPLPTTPQHSLPGARYGLPGPVFHRLDRASLPGAQAIQGHGKCSSGNPGLLRRRACHRARIRATRWLLAMTRLRQMFATYCVK